MRQESSSVTTRRNSYVAPRIGLLAHGFRRLDLHRVPWPSPTHALSGYDEGPLPTYSGGTAPVFHRTSLLCPFGHPSEDRMNRAILYRRRAVPVKLKKMTARLVSYKACSGYTVVNRSDQSHRPVSREGQFRYEVGE